jgi:hypothetical protein
MTGYSVDLPRLRDTSSRNRLGSGFWSEPFAPQMGHGRFVIGNHSGEASGETSTANCTYRGVDRFTAKWLGENWLLLVGPLGFEPRTYGL